MGYDEHVLEPMKALEEIHHEINVGEEYGLAAIEKDIRGYLDSLEVI